MEWCSCLRVPDTIHLISCFDGTNTKRHFLACSFCYFTALSQICSCSSLQFPNLPRVAIFDSEANKKDKELSKSVDASFGGGKKSVHYCAAEDLDSCQRVEGDEWLFQLTKLNFCHICQGFQKFIPAGMIPILTGATKSERLMFKRNDKSRTRTVPCLSPETSAHGAVFINEID